MKPLRLIGALFLLGIFLPILPDLAPAKDKPDPAQLAREERRLLEELDTIERRIDEINDRLVPLEKKIALVRDRLVRSDREIEAAEKRLEKQQTFIKVRLRAMYRLKRQGVLPVLLQADSLPDMIKRYRHLTWVLRHDDEALSLYEEQSRDLRAQIARLKADQKELYRLRERTGMEKEKLVAVHHKKASLLMQVHRRKETYLALQKSQEESRETLVKEVIISPRDRKASPAPQAKKPKKWEDFAKHKGRIPRPVKGKITGRFGRTPGPFKTYTKRRGLMFQVSPGARVRAVMPGEVIHTGWLKGYGNIVIINHGRRYYTLTGGLSGPRPNVGQWVDQGDILGVVPKGSIEKQKDIYFEIRYKGRALDPGKWIEKKPTA